MLIIWATSTQGRVKIMFCSYRGTAFGPHVGWLAKALTPAPGHPMPSSDLCRHKPAHKKIKQILKQQLKVERSIEVRLGVKEDNLHKATHQARELVGKKQLSSPASFLASMLSWGGCSAGVRLMCTGPVSWLLSTVP